MNSLAILLMGLICDAYSDINDDPIVRIGESEIIGQKIRHLDMEVNQYLGVPYADPPVGNLRFMPTKPLSGLPKVLMAVHQPPACHQYAVYPFPWYANTTEKSEDCLYLNIWTPTDASPQNTKAVIYWIHGGSFRMGSIRQELYSGIALATLGDIIVVTVNYRVGPFGYLTSNTEDAPGNAGLWDTLEGLRWVNKNIHAFGGDSSRITIAGESCGSMQVGMLSVSPLGQNLFKRQIMQSGAPTFLAFENRTLGVTLTQYFGTLVGCTSDDYNVYDHPKEVVECLRGVDAATLAELDMSLMSETTVTFGPQYGDEILPLNPRLEIVNGNFHSTEMLVGVNENEGSQLSTNYVDIFGFYGEKEPQLNKTAAKDLMRKIFASFPQPEDLINYYLSDAIPEHAYEHIRQQVFTVFGDHLLFCPTVYHAEKTAEKVNDVHFYFWVHRPSTTIWAPWMSATHFGEVEFVFGQPVLHPKRYQPEEFQISKQVIEIWSSFVKDGKPSIPWPLYSKDSPIFQYIGPGTEIQNHGMGPHRWNCDFLRPYYGF